MFSHELEKILRDYFGPGVNDNTIYGLIDVLHQHTRVTSVLRVSCNECETDCGDMVPLQDLIDHGWCMLSYVGPVDYDDDTDSRWWDWLGVCPSCAADPSVIHTYGKEELKRLIVEHTKDEPK